MHELLLRISSTPWHTQTKMRRGSSQNNYILSLRTLPIIVSSVTPLGALQLSVLPFNSSSCAAILRSPWKPPSEICFLGNRRGGKADGVENIVCGFPSVVGTTKNCAPIVSFK